MPLHHRVSDAIQALGRRVGLHITSLANTLPQQRQALLSAKGIDLVLDVGANVGGYVHELRRLGYGGEVLSFEPIAEVFAELQRACGGDPRWRGQALALSDTDGHAEIRVSQNAVSSSLLTVTAASTAAAAATATTRVEAITSARLDSLRSRLLAPAARVHLKVDVQGFERQVLAGAQQTLAQVHTLELELSLVELYAGQALMPEMLALAAAAGFSPVWLERGFKDPRSGHLLQMDGLFVRQAA